jgi:hypothetical protein
MNIKVVELIKIYYFYFSHFFIRQNDSNIVHKIYISRILYEYKRDILDLLTMLLPLCQMNKWLNNQNKSYRSWEVIQLCSWQLFHLNSFCQGKLRLNFSNLKFEFFKRPRMEKQPKKVMKLCSYNFLIWNHLVMKKKINFQKFKIWIF